MSKRIAVYPGSFDPPTFGHLDLIERASKMFDQVIVAVASNNEKAALFTVDERKAMLRTITRTLKNVEIDSFRGLTVDFARERNAVALVRGLRVVSDFEYELTMAVTNRKLNSGIDTVCLMPSESYMLLSSRIIKEVVQFGGDVTEFVPNEVKKCLLAKFSARTRK